jgi:hypothetical protein
MRYRSFIPRTPFTLPMTLSAEEREQLAAAVDTLENPGLAFQLTSVLGRPIEYGMSKLPGPISTGIRSATEKALRSALRVAVLTLKAPAGKPASNKMHKALSMLSGAIGGAFGLPALALELPVSTTVMLRSLADIARAEGEDVRTVETQLACLEVFALGSKSEADNGAETGYYATRAALAHSVTEAARYLAEKGLIEEGAPALVKLIAKIAARFSIPVSQKFAAQSVPAIGAAGGVAVNLVFLNHFQDMARGHFTVRRLERKYGEAAIAAEYEHLRETMLEGE